MVMVEKIIHNEVKKIRENLLMSKAELARKAGLSSVTIDRIEKGMSCRTVTKRKIILALGYDLLDRDKIFPYDQRGGNMPARNLEKRFGIVAIEKGYITKDQLDNAIITQMTDEVLKREHKPIGTILLDQGHITGEQIDEALGVIKQNLS